MFVDAMNHISRKCIIVMEEDEGKELNQRKKRRGEGRGEKKDGEKHERKNKTSKGETR